LVKIQLNECSRTNRTLLKNIININFTEGTHLTLITFNAKPPSLYFHNDIFMPVLTTVGGEHHQGDHKPGKSGVLGDFYEHGKLAILCNLWGKINKIVSVRSNICMTQGLGVQMNKVCGMTLLLHSLFVVITYGKV